MTNIPNPKSQILDVSDWCLFRSIRAIRLIRNFTASHSSRFQGFTLIELLVVTAMIAILTATSLVSFATLHSSHEINSARVNMLSKLRQVQGYVLNGQRLPGPGVPADAYIITLTAGSESYRIDYEIDGAVALLETVRYSPGGGNVFLNTLTVNGTGAASAVIRISAPYGTMLVAGQPYQVVIVGLGEPSGQNTDLIIDGISGRIAPLYGFVPPPPAPPPPPPPFNFSLSNNGTISVVHGASGSNNITASLTSGISKTVGFTAAGLPSGATASFSPTSCIPTCVSILTITTVGTTPLGDHPIVVTGAYGTFTKTTTFTLRVTPPPPILVSAASTGLTAAQVTWSDNSVVETNNAIERGSAGGACSGFTQAASLGVRSGSTYTDADPTALAAETLYCYRLRADWGTGSNYSGTAVIQTWLNPPATFTLASGGNNKVDLVWSDSSNAETSYAIEYYCTGDTDCPGAFTALTTQSANSVSYTHNIPGSISDGSLMRYRIRAIGVSANSLWKLPTPASFAKP